MKQLILGSVALLAFHGQALAHHSEAADMIRRMVPSMVAGGVHEANAHADAQVAKLRKELAQASPVSYQVIYGPAPSQSGPSRVLLSPGPIVVPRVGDYAAYQNADGSWWKGKVVRIRHFLDNGANDKPRLTVFVHIDSTQLPADMAPPRR